MNTSKLASILPYDLVDLIPRLEDGLSYHQRYDKLYRILVAVLNHATRKTSIAFSGPFARLDHLCRQIHYRESHSAAYTAICALRGRCTHLKQYTEDLLQQNYWVDLKALCDFLQLVLNERVPDDLASRLPKEYPHHQQRLLLGRSMRVAVHHTDAHYLWLTQEDGTIIRMPWLYAIKNTQTKDFSYLSTLVQAGTQINLVRPWALSEPNTETIGEEVYTLFAEQVILEPDCLMDISAIAHCYREYGASPYHYLIDRFASDDPTAAILLGNYAGVALDEIVNQEDNNNELNAETSVDRFVTHNALDFASCPDLQEEIQLADWKQKALEQYRNLQHLVHHSFKEDRTIDLEHVVLEPTFYCEMLGLQGRMDLLQDDKHVLMEQKSGKFDEYRKTHKLTHYVQVLLYQAMLHYAYTDAQGNELHNHDIDTYLLYSKYANGLLKESPAPLLLEEAFSLRNKMVYLDLLLCKGDGQKVLEALKPSTLNVNHMTGIFWEQYGRPQLERVLDVIHNAPAIEKEYFYRMLQFVAREQILGKMGNSRKEASGFAALWNSSTAEKLEAGNLLDALTIADVNEERDIICLNISADETEYLPNFRLKDIVVLYCYPADAEPDARRDMVFRGMIEDLSSDRVVVRLKAPQKNLNLLQSDRQYYWAIEHDFMDSTYRGLYRGLFALLKAPQSRRDLLLGQRAAEVGEEYNLKNDYGAFNELVQKAMCAKDYFLLVGPPGTGKTSCGLVNILKETLADNPQASILMVSYTNRAVDEICSKLDSMQMPYARTSDECVKAQIVVLTTTTATNRLQLMKMRKFQLCIIDEASQILEPHLLAILSATCNNEPSIEKFVMIGDHKQLPAVVQQEEEESSIQNFLLQEIGLKNARNSLFERLINVSDEKVKYMLSAQGRMHHEVADFANQYFYSGKLTEVPLKHQQRDIRYRTTSQDPLKKILVSKRVAFLSVDPDQHRTSDKINTAEGLLIAQVVKSVYELYKENHLPFSPDDTVGIIVPYRHQISIIRQQLESFDIEGLTDISIDTVERYQGSQRDVIIYGFTVQREYQLDFLTSNVFVDADGTSIDRKLNVALTRAREANIMVGHESLLRKVPLFAKLIDAYKTEWKEPQI